MKKTFSILAFVSLTVLSISVGGGETGLQRGPQGTPALQNNQNIKIDADYGKMPLYFIPNHGQMDRPVAYYVQGKDKTIYFTPGGITFALTKQAETKKASGKQDPRGPAGRILGGTPKEERTIGERWVVKLEFVGADKSVKPIGEAKTGAVVSYFKGKPEEWHTGMPTYSKIVYANLWPGIDLVYYGTVNRLKYEFIVHPGADPSKIRLEYRGAEKISVDADGRLQVMTPVGAFNDDVPLAYQDVGGKKSAVLMAYRLEAAIQVEEGKNSPEEMPETDVHVYGFEIGAYDHSKTLVLDPAFLIYCGYIGGSELDLGNGIAEDVSGNAYVTGYTYSPESTFPVRVGPDVTFNGPPPHTCDAFVAKVNPSGTSLIYCGYIGGSSDEYGNGIAADALGNAYVVGFTGSNEATFPVTVGPDLTQNGNADAFVAKVSSAGTSLVYCGYIGGSSSDYSYGIAVDGLGNAYITGETGSDHTTFPVSVGPDLTYNGGSYDAFVAKVNASGKALAYCGYIGGSGDDVGRGIAIDGSGNAYLTGRTTSSEATFPAVVGPDVTYNLSYDAFVAKVNAAGTALVYCGYIGGSNQDDGHGIAVDGSGNACVTGDTMSTEATFPVAVGPDLTFNGGTYRADAFVAKVNAAGTALVYCGYIGGSDDDGCHGIAVDRHGNAYVAGYTGSSEATFPVAVGPDLTINGGAYTLDAFVAKVNAAGTALVYCGYIGGTANEIGYGIALDGAANAYVTGQTNTVEQYFPVIAGPGLIYGGGHSDAFVAKVYYFDERIAKHAVGDFDGDGKDEIAVDFGATGAWIWDDGGWTMLTALNPEIMIAADVNGDGIDEIFLSFSPAGLWVVVGGVGHGISTKHAENMAAGDVDADGAAEVVCDFGADGLWLFDGGTWSKLSGVDADYVTTANVDGTGGDEVIGDFGAAGLWILNAGAWTQLSGVNADYVTAGRTAGPEFLVGDFGAAGLWMWSVGGGWTQISGVNADYMITADTDANGNDEVIGDFSSLGLWLCDSGTWTQLSGVNAVYMIRADVNGDGKDATAVDFGSTGLWLWDNSVWSQLSGAIAEYLVAADLDGDIKDEILADFGALGLWLWNDGSWSQISANNPD